MPKSWKRKIKGKVLQQRIRQVTATLGYRKKPLGSWPDQIKHQVVKSQEEKDSEEVAGHQPSEPADIDKMTKEMGIYEGDQPQEVGVAEELEKNKDG